LGLSLASSLIETQGGTLRLADSRDGGLTVTIELPAARP
jgi:signal transduction histidine kinase